MCVFHLDVGSQAHVMPTSRVANAMNASANIFELLADIDSKFAKFAEKESDTISAEVRKWFKKLAVSESYASFASRFIMNP